MSISVSTLVLTGFVLMLASAEMKHNAGDMHKMVILDKAKLEDSRTKRDAQPMEDFCRKFDQTNEMFHASNIKSLEQLKSACSGRCAKCDNCPGSCAKKIARGCRGLLKDMPPTLKIHSPLQENCRNFIN